MGRQGEQVISNRQNIWLDYAKKIPSPNFNQRPELTTVSLLVVHNISLPPGEFGHDYVEQFFQNQLDIPRHPFFDEIKDLKVSSHLYIKRSGELVQFVPLDQRAWHAGLSSYEGDENCNDFSIGIELEGTDTNPYTDAQYQTLVATTLDIQRLFPAISNERITGHEHIAPGRKTDPGPAFDWPYYLGLLNQKQS